MKLIDPCLVEIEDIDLKDVIEIRIEQLPGNVFKRAQITVKANTWVESEITIKYAGYTIFKGTLVGSKTDYKNCTIKAVYKSGKPLWDGLNGTSINYFVGEEKKRTLFDKLNYKIAANFTNLGAAGWILQEVVPQYPGGVEYRFQTVSLSGVSSTTVFVPFQFVVTRGILLENGVCLPDYYSGCPSGEEVTVYGWVARNPGLPGSAYLGWEVEFYESPQTSYVKTVTNLETILSELSPISVSIVSKTDFLLWKTFQTPNAAGIIDVITQLIGNIPTVIWYDEVTENLQIWFDIPKQSTIELNSDVVFDFNVSQTYDNFPSLIRTELQLPDRPIPQTLGSIPFPSVTTNRSYTIATKPLWVTLPVATVTEYRITLSALQPLNLSAFLDQVARVVQRTSGPVTGRLKTVLLPTLKPYVGVKVGDKTFVAEGFTHVISKAGAYTEISLRGW